jgi:hypothetical protein
MYHQSAYSRSLFRGVHQQANSVRGLSIERGSVSTDPPRTHHPSAAAESDKHCAKRVLDSTPLPAASARIDGCRFPGSSIG